MQVVAVLDFGDLCYTWLVGGEVYIRACRLGHLQCRYVQGCVWYGRSGSQVHDAVCARLACAAIYACSCRRWLRSPSLSLTSCFWWWRRGAALLRESGSWCAVLVCQAAHGSRKEWCSSPCACTNPKPYLIACALLLPMPSFQTTGLCPVRSVVGHVYIYD